MYAVICSGNPDISAPRNAVNGRVTNQVSNCRVALYIPGNTVVRMSELETRIIIIGSTCDHEVLGHEGRSNLLRLGGSTHVRQDTARGNCDSRIEEPFSQIICA